MTFDEMKKMIGKATFPDSQILAKSGLQKLADHFAVTLWGTPQQHLYFD